MTFMVCKTCKREVSSLCNDLCFECHSAEYTAWQQRMAIRQDPAQFQTGKLVNLLLTQHWMHECKIIPDYMPPFPREDTKPACEVEFQYLDGTKTYLRHSKGPLQGFFWDSYGDDMHSPELALIALSQAPAPPRIDVVIPTHGK